MMRSMRPARNARRASGSADALNVALASSQNARILVSSTASGSSGSTPAAISLFSRLSLASFASSSRFASIYARLDRVRFVRGKHSLLFSCSYIMLGKREQN